VMDIGKKYLGCGCYAELYKGDIVLSTEDGAEITLSPEVAEAFLQFVYRVKLETDRQARRN
jgi:hypothetical protein